MAVTIGGAHCSNSTTDGDGKNRPALDVLRSRMIGFLRQEVRSWTPPALHASLFGSAARGDGDTGSDLDLLVVRADNHRDDEAWEAQLYDSGERILAATGNRAGWFVTTPADLRRAVQAGAPLIGEWRRDGVHLAGRRLDPILKEAA